MISQPVLNTYVWDVDHFGFLHIQIMFYSLHLILIKRYIKLLAWSFQIHSLCNIF